MLLFIAKYRKFLAATLAIIVIVSPHLLLAQGLQNPLKYNTIEGFLRAMLDLLIVIAFPIIVLFMVYAGFLFISAQGNTDKLNEAKRIFLWTIVGALIVLGASVLSRAVEGTVNQLRGGSSAPTQPDSGSWIFDIR